MSTAASAGVWSAIAIAVAAVAGSSRLRLTASAGWERLERSTGTHRAALVCFVVALAAFGTESLAWPLNAGRNGDLDLQVYTDMFRANPLFPNLDQYVKPIPALFSGLVMTLGGANLAEVAMAICYAIAVVSVAAAVARIDRRAGLAAAIALLIYPPFGALFHSLSDDSLFALGLSVWLLTIVRAWQRPSARRFALNALVVFALVLVRPTALLFAVFLFFPWLLALPWRERVRLAVSFLAPLVVLLCAFALFQRGRFGEFVISRTGNANEPLYRLFTVDHLVAPSNGPASEALARAVRTDLLPREPYRSYGVTLNSFFSDGSPREWSDLVALSDRVWGWDSNYVKLRSVALEAIEAHPATYAHDVLSDFGKGLVFRYEPGPVEPSPPAAPPGTMTVGGRLLPRPTEGQPIPAANLDWTLSRPAGDAYTVWPSPGRYEVRFRNPADQRAYRHAIARLDSWKTQLPSRRGSSRAASVLDDVTGVYPPAIFWVVASLAGLLLRRPRGSPVAIFAVVLGLLSFLVTVLAQPMTLQYRIPFDPYLIAAGLIALLARPVSTTVSIPATAPPARHHASLEEAR